MNRVLALATSAPKTCMRRLSVTQVRSNKFDITKIKKKQIHFQQENGIPVYLKGGPADYIFFYSTLGLIVFGVSASLHSLYMLSKK